MRIPHYLAERGVAFETLHHPPAYSAPKRAKLLHNPGRLTMKTVALASPEGFFLAVLPATMQVDLDLLSRALGEPVWLADEDQIHHLFKDCEFGAIPPFGSLYGVRTVLDDQVDPESAILFEGNTHYEAIRMRCRDFEWLEQPRRLRFACPGAATAAPSE